MKKLIGIFLCITLFSCEHISAPPENKFVKQFQTDSYPSLDSTFYVNNFTHINVGSVEIRLVDSSGSYINVPDSGVFNTTVHAAPAYCIINGQRLSYGYPKWITINAHNSIHADWTSNVVVFDTGEQN